MLGPRLNHMMGLILRHSEKSAEAILGPVDAMKLRSSATLFAQLPLAPAIFQQVLDRFYDGQPCDKTLDLLAQK